MIRLKSASWIVIGILLLVSSLATPQGVVINEFVASNASVILDEDGDDSDWIELYNAGEAPVNLADWGLTDDPERPFRWTFPDVTIEPGGYLLVWASGKDRRPIPGTFRSGIWRQEYANITGTAIADLVNNPAFPDSPTSMELVTGYFEAPTDFADYYGQRMHGFIIPPVTGAYRFWLASDDNGQLLLSPDDNPDNAVVIAQIPEWTSSRQWDKFPSQQSAPITLQAGQPYYIAALMKEHSGGDNLAVRWQLPSGIIEEPIPGSRLFVKTGELHTNFALSADGETLQLTAPNGTAADQTVPVALIRDVSYGRTADGGAEWAFFVNPTPAASNATAAAYAGIMASPEFSHANGAYADPFELTLASDDPNAEIYYTQDGSTPDPQNLDGTSYGYKNSYPSGEMLYRSCISTLYQDALTIDPSQAPVSGITAINTENSAGSSVPANRWTIENDELIQNTLSDNVRLMFGDAGWTDYELTLQARKDGGNEGFMIFFRHDGNRFYSVNYGGWGNTLHGIEKGYDAGNWSVFVNRVSGSINTGQWYDIRIRCEGNRTRCWLNTTLVFDFTDTTDTQYLSGGVGVGTWQTQSRFRNITVRDLNGTVLYSGLPSPLQTSGQAPVHVVRARAFKAGYIPSEIATATYLPAADPSSGQDTLPVVSLAADEPDFFSYERGIYVAGVNYNNTGNYWMRGDLWERPVHFTLFEPDATVALSQIAGTRIHGGWTRNLPQKSLRLYARGGYGESEFDAPVFPGHKPDLFKRLLLRNSGNDNGQTFFRDAMMQRLVEHLPIDTQAYRPAVMYLNGQYWGLNNLRERFDKYYLYYKYGVDPEQLDILEYLPGTRHLPKEGDAAHFDETLSYIEAHGLASAADYAYIQTRLDTDNFIDYNVAQIFFNNTDWPGNNNDWWRLKTDTYQPDAPYGHDGRWRWMLYDTDFGFGHSGGASSNTLTFATDGNPNNTGWPNPHWTTYLLRKLLENATFRTDFINRYADLLNTAFQPQRVIGVIDEMQAAIAPEMPAHIARWGRPSSLSDWNNQVNVMRTFANQRPDYARGHLRSYFALGVDRQLTLNVNDPAQGLIRVNRTDIGSETPGVNAAQPFPWSGLYFDGIPITVTAVPRPGFGFSHWDGPAGIDPQARTLTLTPTGSLSLTAHFVPQMLLHYWHFNALTGGTVTTVPVDFTVLGGAQISYPGSGTGYMDSTDGSDINAQLSQDAGECLRVRNPSDTRELLLTLPTTGFRAVQLTYAAMRTGSGSQTQAVEYRTDSLGAWQPIGAITLTEDYELFTFDFSAVPAADDNPEFAVRILFTGTNASETSGNNRFDNITLAGLPLPGTNLPPQLLEPLSFTETVEDAVPIHLDLAGRIIDPENAALAFTAESNKPAVVQATLDGTVLTLTPLARGDAVVTITADDGASLPLEISFRLLVYPAAHTLRLGQFRFSAWSPEQPEHTFPGAMLFLQSDVSDPGLTQALDYAYFIPHDDYHADDQDIIGFPYMTTSRTRLNGLGDDGISFINTGRGRDLGGALAALDTTGLDGVQVNWLAGTLLTNSRPYAIRLQYRVGIDGPFRDVSANGQPVEYLRAADGHTQTFGPIELPADAVDQPYVQLLWRYYHIPGTSGSRAQLRLDNLAVAGRMDLFENLALFAQWWLSTGCDQNDYCGGADLTRDGTVDLEDFAALAACWLGE